VGIVVRSAVVFASIGLGAFVGLQIWQARAAIKPVSKPATQPIALVLAGPTVGQSSFDGTASIGTSLDNSQTHDLVAQVDTGQWAAIENVATQAHIIARVKIVDRKAVGYGGLFKAEARVDPENVCGYYYRAQVLESLKGDSSSFQFFAATPDDFKGFDRDYLVMA
jgi:hypothetical protein